MSPSLLSSRAHGCLVALSSGPGVHPGDPRNEPVPAYPGPQRLASKGGDGRDERPLLSACRAPRNVNSPSESEERRTRSRRCGRGEPCQCWSGGHGLGGHATAWASGVTVCHPEAGVLTPVTPGTTRGPSGCFQGPACPSPTLGPGSPVCPPSRRVSLGHPPPGAAVPARTQGRSGLGRA